MASHPLNGRFGQTGFGQGDSSNSVSGSFRGNRNRDPHPFPVSFTVYTAVHTTTMVGHRGPQPEGRFKELTAEFRSTRRGTQVTVKKVRVEYGAGQTATTSTAAGGQGAESQQTHHTPFVDTQYNELRGPSEEPRAAKVRFKLRLLLHPHPHAPSARMTIRGSFSLCVRNTCVLTSNPRRRNSEA